ncbi:15081_t:CDS:2, partial [Racocetra fulgida]
LDARWTGNSSIILTIQAPNSPAALGHFTLNENIFGIQYRFAQDAYFINGYDEKITNENYAGANPVDVEAIYGENFNMHRGAIITVAVSIYYSITALQRLRSYTYGDLQKLILEFFCKNVKNDFNGDPDEFETIELVLDRDCHLLVDYITGAERTNLENSEWIIELKFETVKKNAMFLVRGFSESPYLIKRVRERFQEHVPIIAVPNQPIAATVKGTVKYGLDMSLVESQALKWTTLRIHYKRSEAKYIKDAGMRELGTVKFELKFGMMEIKATAKNK